MATGYRITIFVALLLILIGADAHSQDETPPAITAENVAQLRSVQQWNFADGFHELLRGEFSESVGPLQQAEFESGWFEMNKQADLFVIVTRKQDLWVINDDGHKLFEIQAPVNADGLHARMIDAGFDSDAGLMLVATYSDGDRFAVKLEDGALYGSVFLNIVGDSDAQVVSQWIDCRGEDSYWLRQCTTWIEMVNDDTSLVLRMPSQDELRPMLHVLKLEDYNTLIFDDLSLFDQQPYAPAEDEDAFVRIGRIEPPHVVTSTPDGLVKLWDLQTGAVMAQAQVENGPVVFGQLNAAATHLAWRGPDNYTLNLLDFETGENRIVADLDGAYAQFFLVSQDADVIFLVHVDDEPVVVAYDVESGQRYDLGEFRQCNREPDMARLSADGRTLVIGCDTGLDIWQVVDTDTTN